jgi:hypothetical protein
MVFFRAQISVCDHVSWYCFFVCFFWRLYGDDLVQLALQKNLPYIAPTPFPYCLCWGGKIIIVVFVSLFGGVWVDKVSRLQTHLLRLVRVIISCSWNAIRYGTYATTRPILLVLLVLQYR